MSRAMKNTGQWRSTGVQEVIVVLLHVMTSFSLYAEAAQTVTSCHHFGCFGQPYNITCDTSGDITSDISWLGPGNKEVASCYQNQSCEALPGYRLAVATATHYVLEVARFSLADVGTWSCEDGLSKPGRSCHNTGFEAPSLSALTVDCSKDKEQYEVTCSGLRSHGSPPVALLLSGVRFNATTTTEWVLKRSGTKLNGESFLCSVSGLATSCIAPDVVAMATTTCPGPSCTRINTYFIVFELILVIAGLSNLLVLYLGSSDTGQEEMIQKDKLCVVGIIFGVLLLLLGTVHIILLTQFCTVVGVFPLAGASVCAGSLLIGLGLLVISVLTKVACICVGDASHAGGYTIPEDLKEKKAGNSMFGVEEDTDDLEEESK